MFSAPCSLVSTKIPKSLESLHKYMFSFLKCFLKTAAHCSLYQTNRRKPCIILTILVSRMQSVLVLVFFQKKKSIIKTSFIFSTHAISRKVQGRPFSAFSLRAFSSSSSCLLAATVNQSDTKQLFVTIKNCGTCDI